VCYNSGRILAALGAIEMGRLIDFYHGSYARAGAALTLVYAAGLVLVWFAPETRGQSLPA
jgi:MFS transporter, SHS family, sialic acid transporter